MTILTLENLMALRAYSYLDVEIEGIGTIRVRDIAGADRDRLTRFLHEINRQGEEGSNSAAQRWWEYQLLVVSLAACNEDGSRLIPDGKEAEFSRAVDGRVITRLYEAAIDLNGMSEKAREAAEKNSASSQSSDSGSDSPDTSV